MKKAATNVTHAHTGTAQAQYLSGYQVTPWKWRRASGVHAHTMNRQYMTEDVIQPKKPNVSFLVDDEGRSSRADRSSRPRDSPALAADRIIPMCVT